MTTPCAGHNNFIFSNNVSFTSAFDSGNLANILETNIPFEYLIWTAPDNMGSHIESKQSLYFHFTASVVPSNTTLRFRLMNSGLYNHILYKQDMRPVFKSSQSHHKWTRLKKAVKVINTDEDKYVAFEHTTIEGETIIHFAFTFPYSYMDLQHDLTAYENVYYASGQETSYLKSSVYYTRQILALSPEGRRIDLITISSNNGKSSAVEPTIPGLFPSGENCFSFPDKEVLFISARVHPGEIPSSHTLRGIFDFVTDESDIRAIELRHKYVIKIVPMINPDGVYRGHFRYDQFGHNLNRFYTNADLSQQPAVYSIQRLLDMYANTQQLALYLDLHAHANKKGCFIYGNVLSTVSAQVQTQLYCKLLAMNTNVFDYNSCLFSRKHMYRTDPGDVHKGLTAEGSGRVSTYVRHRVIHSYTLECNYNSGSFGEIIPLQGKGISPQPFLSSYDKYTPDTFAEVGRACLLAWLDVRGQNPVSRVAKSRFRTLDRIRAVLVPEVRLKKEFRDLPESANRDIGKVNGAWRRCESPTGGTTKNETSPIRQTISKDSFFQPVIDVKQPSDDESGSSSFSSRASYDSDLVVSRRGHLKLSSRSSMPQILTRAKESMYCRPPLPSAVPSTVAIKMRSASVKEGGTSPRLVLPLFINL